MPGSVGSQHPEFQTSVLNLCKLQNKQSIRVHPCSSAAEIGSFQNPDSCRRFVRHLTAASARPLVAALPRCGRTFMLLANGGRGARVLSWPPGGIGMMLSGLAWIGIELR